jgi:dTDP-4-amino-4,6-dideoxygalactose transaminase
MSVPFVDLRRELAELRDELLAAIEGVLSGGRLILGPAVSAFEEAFSSWCGAEFAVGVASGTDAVELALRAVGIGPGDEVIVPANTCVPTIAGIEGAGGIPVLADVDAASATLDPGQLEDALTARTRAVIPVHLYGQCADIDPIVEFARRHDLRVVEDAAQAHGAEYRGRRAGGLADAAAFSFYPTKNLGGVGDGGAVVTDAPEVAERVRLLRRYGERERSRSLERGINSRLDELQAAMLLVKLRHLDRFIERRREIARRYDEALDGLSVESVRELDGRRHVYHLYVVRVPERDRFRAALAQQGVETLVHYELPIHRHPPYAELDRPGRLLTSERLASEVVSLPMYPGLRDDECEQVVQATVDALS